MKKTWRRKSWGGRLAFQLNKRRVRASSVQYALLSLHTKPWGSLGSLKVPLSPRPIQSLPRYFAWQKMSLWRRRVSSLSLEALNSTLSPFFPSRIFDERSSPARVLKFQRLWWRQTLKVNVLQMEMKAELNWVRYSKRKALLVECTLLFSMQGSMMYSISYRKKTRFKIVWFYIKDYTNMYRGQCTWTSPDCHLHFWPHSIVFCTSVISPCKMHSSLAGSELWGNI